MQGYQIPPKFEVPFRNGLDHAAKKRIGELRALLDGLSDQQVNTAITLCFFAAAYTVVDVCGRTWPNDASVRRIAENTVKSNPEDETLGLTVENVYKFLSRCALNFEPVNDVFGDSWDVLTLPFVITTDLLAAFGPRELSLWQFLDVVEDAYEKAWVLDLNVLPALMVRARLSAQESGSSERA